MVELGKRDIWSPARVAQVPARAAFLDLPHPLTFPIRVLKWHVTTHSLTQERPDVHFSLLAIDFLPAPLIGRLLSGVAAKLGNGRLSPLRNRLEFPLVAAATAMRALAQASHAGKIIISTPRRGPSPSASGGTADGDGATVAVSGGLGGLGLIVSSWLVSTGAARRLVLLSRSGRLMHQSTASQSHPWRTLGSSAAEVVTFALDPSASEDSAAVSHLGWSFDAVIHAAGVLTDAMLPNQSLGHLRRSVIG